jgi:hypothetical protein
LYDLGAAQSAVLVALGDSLGLYKAMAGAGPLTAAAARGAHGHERGLPAGVAWPTRPAAGTSSTKPRRGTFTLPEEQAMALARDDGPAAHGAAFQAAGGAGQRAGRPPRRVPKRGRRGARGLLPELAEATGRVARARYREPLLRRWLGDLEGVAARLQAGGSVADLGCGEGAAVLALARLFPRARFAGYDSDAPSIDAARRPRREAGLAGSVRLRRRRSCGVPGDGYDL